MRISTAYQFDSYSKDVSSAQERMIEAQNRVSTGKRINRVSDDPFGTTQVLSMTSVKSALTQYQSNLHTAKGFLGSTEQALTDLNSVMTRAYELSVKGANGTNDQASQQAMAQEVGDLQKQLVSLSNSQGPSGNYLFGGQTTDKPPFTVSGTAAVFNGDTKNIVVETSPTDTMVVNSALGTTVTTAYAQLESLKNNLLSGAVSNISSSDVSNIQSAQAAFILERGNVGSKLKDVQAMDDQHSRRTDDLTSQISDLTDVDYAKAITDYRSADAAYQAALTVSSQGFRLSLMDFLK